jgi:hypothetical protein
MNYSPESLDDLKALLELCRTEGVRPHRLPGGLGLPSIPSGFTQRSRL